jgi:hypothetical protein
VKEIQYIQDLETGETRRAKATEVRLLGEVSRLQWRVQTLEGEVALAKARLERVRDRTRDCRGQKNHKCPWKDMATSAHDIADSALSSLAMVRTAPEPQSGDEGAD